MPDAHATRNDIQELDRKFARLIDILNHRITKLEVHARWTKIILGYIAGLVTLLLGTLLSLLLSS